jgi:hypothetical protein
MNFYDSIDQCDQHQVPKNVPIGLEKKFMLQLIDTMNAKEPKMLSLFLKTSF